MGLALTGDPGQALLTHQPSGSNLERPSTANPEEHEMTTTRRTGKTLTLLSAALLPLCLVVGCGGDSSTPDTDVAGVDTAPETPSTSDSTAPAETDEKIATLIETFDDDANGWGLPPNEAGSISVTGGDFVWDLKETGLRPHLIADTLGKAYDAGELEMTDVRVTATVTPRRGAPAFGLFCREVPDTDTDYQWYEFVVRDGYSAIRLADSAGNLEVVEEGDAAVRLGEEAELEITCVGDRLALSLDGEELLAASVSDPLDNGVPGIQAYDSPEKSGKGLLLAWHDFAVEPA